MRHALAAALGISLFASSAMGAKPTPPPPSGTATPDLGYVQITGGRLNKTYTIYLANEDGSGASSVYSTSDSGQMLIRMGPKADHTIVVIQGGRFSLLRYALSSTGATFVSIEPLVTIANVSGAQMVDFSPNGKDIAYFRGSDNSLWNFNLDTRASTKVAQLASYINGISFDQTGSNILFVENASSNASYAVVKSVPTAGGNIALMGLEGDYNGIESSHTSGSFILTRHFLTETMTLEYHAGSSTPVILATGYLPSFRCDDRMVVYQHVSNGSVSLLEHDMVSGLEHTLTSNGNNYRPDYIPTCS